MKTHDSRPLLAATLAVAGCAVVGMAPGAMADDDGDRSRDRDRPSDRDTGYIRGPLGADGDHRRHDHDDARRLLERGDIRPLADILARVGDDLPGRIIATEFEREDGVYVYEFYVIDGRGRVREVYVDAATARILKVEDED